MTNLEKIEAAIRSALPELMELTEGCEYTINGMFGTYTYIDRIGELGMEEVFSILDNEPDTCDYEWFERQEINIIGHPVTILHLLRWLDVLAEEHKICYADLFQGGTLVVVNFDLDDLLVNNYLDLSKPLLRDQSEEVINELVKLVG